MQPSPILFLTGDAADRQATFEARDLVFVFLTNVWYGDDTPCHDVLRRVYRAWDDEGA